jgi:predicted component of type VI protein secretion system
MTSLGLRWAALLGLSCVAACRTPPPASSATEHLRVQLRATADSNGALPVYYAVRAVADESAFAEGYDAALARTLQAARDEGIVDQGLLRPHSTLERQLEVPRGRELLLYVFFTSRDAAWKLHLERTHERPIALVVSEKAVLQQRGTGR